jgi:protein FAM50
MNKSIGPGGKRLFGYSADAPSRDPSDKRNPDLPSDNKAPLKGPLTTAATKAAAVKAAVPINILEGAGDDPTFTKVVDRRWYERNKHIYPANVWQDFDPEKDYTSEVRRDPGGNAFFFSR